MLQVPETGVQPHEVGELQRTHRVAQAKPQGFVYVRGARHALVQHVHRLVAHQTVDPARHKSWELLDLDGLLAHPLRDVACRLYRLVGGFQAPNELDELHLVCRIEKVHGDAAFGAVRRGGYLRRAHRRGVGGEHGALWAQLVEPAEDLQLQLHLLGDGLYNEVGLFHGLLEALGRGDALQASAHLTLVDPVPLDRLLHLFLDPLQHPGVHVLQGHPKTAQCSGVDDAPPHSSRPNDGHPLDLHDQSSRLTEGRHTGQGVAQDQGVHLVGALVGQDAFQVVGVAYNGVVERNAVPAQDGARLPRYLYGLPNVVQLADGYLLGAQDALVLHPSDVQRKQRALVYLHHHVHELFLRELETGNRLAELLAPLRVLQGALKTVPPGPHRAPDDPVSRLVEAGEGALEPFGLGEHRPFGEPDLFEEEFALDRGAHRKLARYVSGGEPLSRRGHEEAANAVIGLGPHDCHIGYGSHPDPTLPAVQDPLRALLAGEGLHAGRIAPRLGLGEAEAAYRLTFGHSGEPLVLLLLGAELVDGAHRERALHADEGPETRVAGLELHAGEAVLDGALTGAAVPGEVHAEPSLLAHLRHDLPGKDRLLPPLRDVRRYPLPDERADLLARRALLIREQDVEVHKVARLGGPRPGRTGPGGGGHLASFSGL